MNPVAWQTINILFRGRDWSVSGAHYVWLAEKILLEIGWICLLLAVYPAFTQHSVAVTYTRHFACIALFALSLLLNLLALDNPRRWWLYTSIAGLASLLQLITLEYFFGLELLRPIFIDLFKPA